MSLRKSLDRVFADVEGVYDMRTTDREKIVEINLMLIWHRQYHNQMHNGEEK